MGRTVRAVRRVGTKYECALCGKVIPLPEGTMPVVTLQVSNGKPTYRIVSVDRIEIHRCRVR